MIEEELKERLDRIEAKLDKLIKQLIPEIRDVSKYLKEAKELVVKGKPPRKQPKKKGLSNKDAFFASS